MSKRKFRIEEDFYVAAVNDEPPQTSSENEKHLRKGSDDVNHYRNCESAPARCEFAEPEPKKSTHPISEAAVSDQNSKETPDPKIDTITADASGLDCFEGFLGPIKQLFSRRIPSEITIESPLLITDDCYKMLHSTRAICLVFIQEISEGAAHPGSTVDVERIEATFGRLNFEVIVCKNYSKSKRLFGKGKVSAGIKKWSKPEHHKDKDCLCVFVLTYGHENDITAFYNNDVYEKREIWEPFTADKCQTLAGKPKLFFFQACRGNKLDSRANVKQKNSCFSQTEADGPPSYKIPISADFLFAHGCAEGFSSGRDPEHGSWYVETLCKVLDEFSETTDLLQMLTVTAQKVATVQYESLSLDKIEVPPVTSTLIRDLYFTKSLEPKKSN